MNLCILVATNVVKLGIVVVTGIVLVDLHNCMV
jgi:hypothetical protein